MSHDTEAAYASSEIADILTQSQDSFFGNIGTRGGWTIYAGRESGCRWPLADGIIQAENTTAEDVRIAIEYKRTNEGVHGILTAIGQSYAYLEKGYDAAIMVIPSRYSSHPEPGNHVKRVIESASPKCPIAIYTYTPPDLSATRPFQGKLKCVRDISIPDCCKIGTGKLTAGRSGVSTLWAHIREGMSHPDAFFRYCQSVKVVTTESSSAINVHLPKELETAVKSLAPKADPCQYLSYTTGDSISDKAWRHLWFNYLFWEDLIPIYKKGKPYVVNDTATRIKIDADCNQVLFSGRSDSIKNVLVGRLNTNDSPQSLEAAWREYAEKVRKNAHSYREVIDSGLDHIGFIAGDGSLTDLGFKFVEACERINSPYSGVPLEILRGAFLQNGKFAALLHYIYKYSEEKFNADFKAFASPDSSGELQFDQNAYVDWLDDVFVNELHISKKSSLRAGGTRRPLQAEFAYLKKLGLVNSTPAGKVAFRVGVGLSIDWPRIQNSILFFNNLVG